MAIRPTSRPTCWAASSSFDVVRVYGTYVADFGGANPLRRRFSQAMRAGRIVAAAEASGGNICQVDGQMIGRPIVEQARRVLAVTRSDRDSRFEHIARVVS